MTSVLNKAVYNTITAVRAVIGLIEDNVSSQTYLLVYKNIGLVVRMRLEKRLNDISFTIGSSLD